MSSQTGLRDVLPALNGSPGLFDPTEGLRPQNGSQQFVWGIDPGTRAIAFGFDPGHETHLLELPKLDTAERLGVAYELIEGTARALAERFPPLVIWLEQPGGKFVEPPLIYMVGVIQAALWNALRDVYAAPVSTWTLTAPEWKKHAIGYGAAKKRDVLEWALREGARRGVTQDEADALAMARAGRLMIR